MTNEERKEAIGVLENAKNFAYDEEYTKAFDLGIEALKQASCEDWLDVPSDEMTLEQARQAVKDLRKKLADTMCEDAVSRKEVCKQINRWIGSGEYEYTNATNYLAKRIVDLPSVTPARGHGEWIQEEYWSEGCGMGESYGHWFRCSKCGKRVKDGYKKCNLDFCSKCGADMKGTKLPYTDKSGLEYVDQPTLRSAT